MLAKSERHDLPTPAPGAPPVGAFAAPFPCRVGQRMHPTAVGKPVSDRVMESSPGSN